MKREKSKKQSRQERAALRAEAYAKLTDEQKIARAGRKQLPKLLEKMKAAQ